MEGGSGYHKIYYQGSLEFFNCLDEKFDLDEILGFHHKIMATHKIRAQNITENRIQFMGDRWGIKEYLRGKL